MENLSELDRLKLERKGRFYKKIIINAFLAFSLFIFLYLSLYFRSTAKIVVDESLNAYKFCLQGIYDFSQRKLSSFLFPVEKIKIEGLNYLTEKDVNLVIDNVRAKNNTISIREIQKYLLEIPLVSDVNISRVIGSKTINIDIKEKQLIGIIKSKDQLLAIDKKGNIVPLLNFRDMIKDLIIVDGDKYDSYVKLYSYLYYKNLSHLVFSAEHISNRRWNILFKNGLLVKLPSKEVNSAIDVLIELNNIKDIITKKSQVSYIDLRVKNKVFVQI